MQIDFHFGVTYVVSRIAGFKKEEAYKIAYSAQYVDDAVHEGTIHFSNRASYNFIASAHKMLDYRNFEELANHHVWIPFHFLPGNQVDPKYKDKINDFEQRLVCRPNSEVAQEMLRSNFEKRDEAYALHLLGISMHVYADTWAHQGFCGISHQINQAKDIFDSDGKIDHEQMKYIKQYFNKNSLWEKFKFIVKNGDLSPLIDSIKSLFVSDINPLGHGSVLSYPDLPYLYWMYENFNGDIIHRNNPNDFALAVKHMYVALKNFRQEEDTEIPEEDFKKICTLLTNTKVPNGEDRLMVWIEKIKEGHFSFGPELVEYIVQGKKSWLFKALGFEKPHHFKYDHLEFDPNFLDSDWKHLHDALIQHRFSVLHNVLPKFRITAA